MLTYERTGSTWLCNVLDPKNGTHEIFCEDPMLFIDTLIDLCKNFYHIDESIINTISKIYSPENFFIDPIRYREIMGKIVNKKPYSINLFYSIKNIYQQLNKNLLFKIFPPQFLKFDISPIDILNSSDYLIYNYRNDILRSFISFKKAMLTGQWTSTHETTRKNLGNNTTRIYWDENEYNQYKNYILNTHSQFYNIFTLFNKPKISISYEELHEDFSTNENKFEYIRQKLKLAHIVLDCHPCYLQKQNKYNIYNNAESVVSNYESFYDSLPRIKTKIYE
jgi:hypothetical protein